MIRTTALALALAASLPLPLAAQTEASQTEAARTIIVMDGSGSMWGQIDGRAKLEIARETVGTVLGEVPATQEIGLLAYGHRRKGDCADIELVVPPAAGTASQIAQTVNAMRFLGKTPLSAAVREAAEALRYGEEAATVVLVTDGLETCDADPCALGRELEEGGLNFTAHVIGFGLTQEEGAQVACLAQETGGRYIEARDAADLTRALTQTVSAPPAPPVADTPPTLTATLEAPDSAPIGTVIDVAWTAEDVTPFDTITIAKAGEEGYDSYVYASWGNPARIQTPGEVGDYELRFVNRDQTVIATRPIAVTPAPVSLTAVDAAIVGQYVPVTWQGPNAEYDTLQVQQADGSYLTYAYLNDLNPLVLQMPDQPGSYSIVYMLNDREPLTSRPIEVLAEGSAVPPVPSSLTAPDRVVANTDFPIGWSGPNAASDSVWLRLPGDAGWVNYVYLADGNPVEMRAPDLPGTYELVYKLADVQDLATRMVEVVAADAPVPVTISADDGGAFNVILSGTPAPENAGPVDAWAMNEGVAGPVETTFLPGDYDIRGDAGDQVFAGRITVTADGDNRFVIPLDPARSPAGPDQEGMVAPAPGDPVKVRIAGADDGRAVRWQATPVSGQDSLMLGLDPTPDGWDTALDPGRWLIEGFADGDDVPTYAMALDVGADTPATVTPAAVGRPTPTPEALPTGQVAQAQCVGDASCRFTNVDLGVQGVLMPGWAADRGLFYETAGGAVADQPTIEFYAGTPLAVAAVLNPRQWDGMLGPCTAIDLGGLCAMTEADPAAVALLASTLTAMPQGATSAPTASAAPAAGDIPIPLPEGFDPTEYLAPGLLEN